MISIIITTINEAKEYLEMAVKSACEQTIEKEVIVIDSGKQDCVKDVCDRYNVKIIQTAERLLLPHARNRAIKESIGDYIICLDCDDTFYSPTVLEEMVKLDGDIIYGKMICSNGVLSQPNKDIKIEDWKNNQIYQSSLYKRKVWDTINGYWEYDGELFEDWDFWLRAFITGFQFTYYDGIVYNYTIRENGGYNRIKDREEQIKQVIFEHCEYRNYNNSI